MLDSLYVGAAGMVGQQMNVETIANNLANANTTAFKKSRVNFQELYYRETNRLPESEDTGNVGGLAGAQVGTGVATGAVQRLFGDGEIKASDGALDLAIRGNGLFEVSMPDGSSGYTRSGALQINSDRLLATTDGKPLYPAIEIPEGAKDVLIDAKGAVTAVLSSGTQREEVAQIELVNFPNPGALKSVGNGIYVAAENSGDPVSGKPGDDGFGALAQGFLESSNVKLIDELVGLMVAQRAYEANSKIVQTSDDLMGIANNLRR